jgi:hypothetical protein
MIRYALKCANAHEFESWFQSAGAYDSLSAAGHVACPLCGSAEVAKTLMAPQVQPARTRAATRDAALREVATTRPAGPAVGPGPVPGPLSAPPETALEQALADLRKRVEEGSDYVGMNFAAEARAIHDGTAPERAIWGEARVEDARALIEDGIPVAPLPFRPKAGTN